MLFAQHAGSQSQVAQFQIRFLQRDLVVFAGSKTAIGIKDQAFRRHVCQCLLDVLDNALGHFDVGETHIQAPQPNSHGRGQLTQHGQITRHWDAVLQEQEVGFQPPQVVQQGLIASLGSPAAPTQLRRHRWTASVTPATPSTIWLIQSTARAISASGSANRART